MDLVRSHKVGTLRSARLDLSVFATSFTHQLDAFERNRDILEAGVVQPLWTTWSMLTEVGLRITK